MGDIERKDRWVHVVIDIETQEPTTLSDDEIEAVDDALATGKGLELLSVVPTTDYRGAVEAIEQARDLIAQAYSDDEHDDSPGNMAYAVLNAALTRFGGR